MFISFFNLFFSYCALRRDWFSFEMASLNNIDRLVRNLCKEAQVKRSDDAPYYELSGAWAAAWSTFKNFDPDCDVLDVEVVVGLFQRCSVFLVRCFTSLLFSIPLILSSTYSSLFHRLSLGRLCITNASTSNFCRIMARFRIASPMTPSAFVCGLPPLSTAFPVMTMSTIPFGRPWCLFPNFMSWVPAS